MTGKTVKLAIILAVAAAIILAIILAVSGRSEGDTGDTTQNTTAEEGTEISQNQPPEASDGQTPEGSGPLNTDINTEPETETGTETETETEEPYTTNEIDPSKPMAALTFDDGPSAATTPLILDLLEQYHISASFFLIGRNIGEDNYEVIQRMVNLGCEVNSHTWSHKDLTKLTVEEIQAEINKASDAIYAAAGIRPALVRPPYGSINDTVRSAVGVPMIRWSVDTMDWSSKDPEAILEEVQNNAFDGCIILMHDIYDTTVEASKQVIPWLLEQGYQLVTVSQLMEARGVPLEPGNDYRYAKPQ